MSNTVKYTTPDLQGFSGELAYAFGEVAGDSSAQRIIGAALAYKNGPLNVRLGYNNKNNDTAVIKGTSNAKNTLLAANYNFGIARAHLAYGVNKGLNSSALVAPTAFGAAVAPTASTDSANILLGVAVPFGVSTVLTSYVRKDDKTRFNQDADQFGVGYHSRFLRRYSLAAAVVSTAAVFLSRATGVSGAAWTGGQRVF